MERRLMTSVTSSNRWTGPIPTERHRKPERSVFPLPPVAAGDRGQPTPEEQQTDADHPGSRDELPARLESNEGEHAAHDPRQAQDQQIGRRGGSLADLPERRVAVRPGERPDPGRKPVSAGPGGGAFAFHLPAALGSYPSAAPASVVGHSDEGTA